MSGSQWPPRNTNGPSRDGHDRDRVRSHNISHHNHNGTANHQQNPSQNTTPFQQQTQQTNGYTHYQPTGSSQDPRNGHGQHAAYDQSRRYIPVTRPWNQQNPDIDRAINHPALNYAPLHQTQYYAHPAPPPPPPPPPAYPPNNTPTHRLTSANLQALNQHRPPRNVLRRLERQDPRTGPYDAVGRIRRDGQVYEEDAEWSEGYHDYDARSDMSR